MSIPILNEEQQLQSDLPRTDIDIIDLETKEKANKKKVRYGNSGFQLPSNWNSLSMSQKKLYLNQGKPCISPIFFSILFENGKREFGISNAKSNFNLPSFEAEKLQAFPNAKEITFYDNDIMYKAAQKG